nr:HD domain-containing protein [Clostridium muellerianum]
MNEVGGEAYIVGEFVREKLINFKNQPGNLNILYDGDINKLLISLEDVKYKFLPIQDNDEVYIYDDGNINFNIERLKEKGIEEYLGKRDFSINSICVKILGNKIIDPFNGRRAIECRIIKHINDTSIEQDPVRILRGIRFCIKYGMHFNLETEKKVVEMASKLKDCDKRSVFNEFMNLVQIDSNGKALEFLDNYNILKYIFPYVEELKTIGKCKHHAEDAFTHMNLTYEIFKDIINGKIQIKGFDLGCLENYISNFKIKDYVSVACFLHDIGKFKCYKEEEDSVSFLDHEKEGSKIVNDICLDMKFPKISIELMVKLVEAHMCPLGIFKMDESKRKEAAYKFFDKYNEYVYFILILSFCDNYATYDYLSGDSKQNYKNFIEDMIREYGIYKFKVKE